MLSFPTLGIPVDGWYTSYLLAKVEIIISRQVKYLPEWLPETDSKRTARKWRSILQRFCDKPVKFEKRQMVRFELVQLILRACNRRREILLFYLSSTF